MTLLPLLLMGLAAVAAPSSVTSVRDSYPHLSPDGGQLLFHSNRSGRQAIWIARSDGGGPRILFDNPQLGEDPGTAVWSPDGRQIAFAMKPAGAEDPNESEIYLMDADGNNLRRLTRVAGDDSHPHWSRSGRIYFNSARATPDLKADWSRQWIDIYSMAADGNDVRRHTDCRSVCTYPAPSPDERSIVYRRVDSSLGLNWDLSPAARNSEIYVKSLDSNSEVNVSRHAAFDGWPTWSADGRWVVFASNRDRLAYTGQIFAVRPDGEGIRALTSGSWSRVQPSFSAGGERMFVYESVENVSFELGHIASFAVQLNE